MKVRRDSMARSNAEANMKSELADFQARAPPCRGEGRRQHQSHQGKYGNTHDEFYESDPPTILSHNSASLTSRVF